MTLFARLLVAAVVAPAAQAASPSVELLVPSSEAVDAAWLPLPQGPPAIVVMPTASPGGAVTLVAEPEAQRWRAVPSPGGVVVAAADGLHSLFAEAGHPWEGRRWWLDSGQWVPGDPLPPEIAPGSTQAVSVAEDGAATVWTSTGGWLRRQQAQGAGWGSSTVGRARAWTDDGRVYWQDATAVQRAGRRWRSPAVPTGTLQVFDEGPGERPLSLRRRSRRRDRAVVRGRVPHPAARGEPEPGARRLRERPLPLSPGAAHGPEPGAPGLRRAGSGGAGPHHHRGGHQDLHSSAREPLHPARFPPELRQTSVGDLRRAQRPRHAAAAAATAPAGLGPAAGGGAAHPGRGARHPGAGRRGASARGGPRRHPRRREGGHPRPRADGRRVPDAHRRRGPPMDRVVAHRRPRPRPRPRDGAHCGLHPRLGRLALPAARPLDQRRPRDWWRPRRRLAGPHAPRQPAAHADRHRRHRAVAHRVRAARARPAVGGPDLDRGARRRAGRAAPTDRRGGAPRGARPWSAHLGPRARERPRDRAAGWGHRPPRRSPPRRRAQRHTGSVGGPGIGHPGGGSRPLDRV